MNNKRYPIGQFEKPDIISQDLIAEWISNIAAFPQDLSEQVQSLSDEQMDIPYRKNGWTLRQVVHHCADSHMNAFCRIKLALTEDCPVIKPYFEAEWAKLADSEISLDASLFILRGLHKRWEALLKSLSHNDLNRNFIHPEGNKKTSIAEAIGMYSWHCKHHFAHIMIIKTNLYGGNKS